MSNLLSGITTKLFGRSVPVYAWPVVQLGVDAGGNPVPLTAGSVRRTPAIAVETNSGNSPVAAGAKSVTFIFSSDFAGTVLTKSIDAAEVASLGFEAPAHDTLAAIAYTVTAGSVTITTLI